MTNVDLFQVLASEDAAEQERVAGSRAVIAVQSRATERFAKFVAKATSQDEIESRLTLIDSNLREIAASSAEDYGYDDPERLFLAATVALGGGHASDCGCGFCENKGSFGKDDESETEDTDEDDFEKDASAKTADVETGDHYQSETISLPEADASGLGSEASPAIDKGKADNLKSIDVDSVRNRLEHQEIGDKPDLKAADFDPSSPLRKTIDADKPLQPEHNVGERTDSFGNQAQQADPVTAKIANWLVVT